MPDSISSGDTVNPYRSPASLPLESLANAADDSQTRALRAFVGPNADYYLRKWAGPLAGTGDKIGMNWGAFFFSGLWIPYRKMYRITLIFFGAILAESILEQIVFQAILGMEDTPRAIDLVINFSFAAICGMLANRWYLSHAQRVIAEIRAEGLDTELMLSVLAERGGTSVLSAIGLFAAFMFTLFVALTALQIVTQRGI